MCPTRWASLGSRLCVEGGPVSLVPVTEARFLPPAHALCVCEPLVLLLRQNLPLAGLPFPWAKSSFSPSRCQVEVKGSPALDLMENPLKTQMGAQISVCRGSKCFLSHHPGW